MTVTRKTVVAAVCSVWAFCGLFLPAPAAGEDLDRQVASMMTDFEPVIRSLSGDDSFVIAAGAFFDPQTRNREPLCRDAEARVFDQVMKRFALSKRAVIVDWKRSAPLKAETGDVAGTVRYLLSGASRQLANAPARGYLITGYADSPGGNPRLRAELIAIPEGTVAGRFGPPLTAEEAGAIVAAPLTSVDAAPSTAAEASPKPAAEKPAAPPLPGDTAQPPPAAAASSAMASSAAAAPSPAPAPAVPGRKAPPKGPPASQTEQAALSSTVIQGKNFRYEGQVDAEGRKHGHGTLTFDTGDAYTGQWEADRMNGEGSYTFSDGDKYVGQWRDNKMHGRGTYHYANGDRYTGRFVNDVKDGPGTYHFTNGDRWEGSYLKGQKHGKAVYVWKNGQTKEEHWNQGKKVQ